MGDEIGRLMAGSNVEGDTLIEDLGDPMVLLDGDWVCRISMVCEPSAVGKCL